MRVPAGESSALLNNNMIFCKTTGLGSVPRSVWKVLLTRAGSDRYFERLVSVSRNKQSNDPAVSLFPIPLLTTASAFSAAAR